MPTLVVSTPPAPVGRWQRLLDGLGLAAWFRRPPAGTPTGHEERVLLLLTLTNAPLHSPEPLAAALVACGPALAASGGQVVEQHVNRLLLSWPAHYPAAWLAIYQHLRAHLHQQLGEGPQLYGAATLGLLAPRPSWLAPGYRGAALGQVAGILHEGRAQGYPLLLSAALHYRLGIAALPCQLHLAFNLSGHRYPATLYWAQA